ncbi:alpha/beta fold hydrolase [Streptomyces sp. NPDC020817]|uniref:alpha/beta fold hydrolase n=1 Tax=Streptomyces sp. NPDC020817 TaxID=3365095 RepID=UPI003793ACE5
MVERVIEEGGIRLCTESFGDPGHPAVLLVMGAGASMLWWDEGFCRALAGGGRFVIRYDHRDTGRSLTYEPGRPEYTGADLVGDAARVLDAYGVPAAHVVGVSAGGALAQRFALDHAARVLSLVLISTTSAVSGGGRVLPPPTAEFLRFVSTSQTTAQTTAQATTHADRSDADSVVEHQVDFARLLAGGRRPFDEAAVRSLVRRDIRRAHDFAAARNHDLLPDGDPSPAPLSSIAVPTLVIHGTADPMFPLPHGEALAQEIPGARLLVLQDAGHGVERADRDAIVPAILEHTSADPHP